MGRLQGKTALVTGGARGLGKAACQAMAKEGANIVITDLRESEGEALAAALLAQGSKAIFLAQDVTDEARWDQVIAETVSAHGRLDILVNNAGIIELGTIEDTSFTSWQRTQAVNLDGVFLGTRAGVRAMKNSGGSIINLSSIEGLVGNAITLAYNASKGGVRLLSKSAALYCAQAGYNIRVNSIHPGPVTTNLLEDAFASGPPELSDLVLAATPIGRFGVPDDIANGIVFLASDDSSYMTGSELVIDGGYTAQ
jgi:NAD(P)-dependent dehydrogenase (short-subunit alcohol dehydrogenase family)